MTRGAHVLSIFVFVLCGHNGGSFAVEEPSPNTAKDPPFKEVQPGIFELGSVKINRRERTVSFPAVVNLKAGAMEYFVVSTWGKVHESILRTETEPYHIHAAMLLLGAK